MRLLHSIPKLKDVSDPDQKKFMEFEKASHVRLRGITAKDELSGTQTKHRCPFLLS